MSYAVIPLPQAANVSLATVLDNNVETQINLTTTDHGLYIDVTYDGVPVINARLCQDRTDLNPAKYLGMPQNLFFADTQGTSNPQYTGFGSRWLLCYGAIPVSATPPAGSYFVASGGELDSTFVLDQSTLG